MSLYRTFVLVLFAVLTISMVSRKVAIFVDGCFWHMCPKCFRMPESNVEYWKPKLERNVERDREQNATLKSLGWKVIRTWEHEIDDGVESVIKNIADDISGVASD